MKRISFVEGKSNRCNRNGLHSIFIMSHQLIIPHQKWSKCFWWNISLLLVWLEENQFCQRPVLIFCKPKTTLISGTFHISGFVSLGRITSNFFLVYTKMVHAFNKFTFSSFIYFSFNYLFIFKNTFPISMNLSPSVLML